jgi:hypothetical protein
MRSRGGDGIVNRVAKLVGVFLATGTAYVAARELPTVWRYFRILRAAKSRSRANLDLHPSPDKPEYAQAPRRAGADDGKEARRRRATSPSSPTRPLPGGEVDPSRPLPSH